MDKKRGQQKEHEEAGRNDFPEPEPLFPFKGYLILNIIFWVYCIIQMLVLRWLFRDTIGLFFFFTVLGVGFTLVSAYDYIFDRVAWKTKNHAAEKKEEE